jgi:hypothetical protein
VQQHINSHNNTTITLQAHPATSDARTREKVKG